MHNPPDLRYTPEHEWIRVEGNRGTVGITHFAQNQLGDIVFVELPEIGRTLNKGELFGVVESVKTVSDLYAPVSGTVVGRNEALVDHPELVNQQPTGEGWMIVLELSGASLSELDSLLSAEAYEARTQGV